MNYKDAINRAIKEYKFCFFHCKNGKTYLVWQHHKYLSPMREGIRVLIANKQIDKNPFHYLTDPIK